MQTYNEYFKEQKVNLYGNAKVKMPKPELYVIFTGERSHKPEYISLSEEFFDGQDCGIDARIKVIYDGADVDIINQYVNMQGTGYIIWKKQKSYFRNDPYL